MYQENKLIFYTQINLFSWKRKRTCRLWLYHEIAFLKCETKANQTDNLPWSLFYRLRTPQRSWGVFYNSESFMLAGAHAYFKLFWESNRINQMVKWLLRSATNFSTPSVITLAVPQNRESAFHRHTRSKAWLWQKAVVHTVPFNTKDLWAFRTLNLGESAFLYTGVKKLRVCVTQ